MYIIIFYLPYLIIKTLIYDFLIKCQTQIANVLFGIIDLDVLYGTEVIFNYLSHLQARLDALLFISSVSLKYSIGYVNCFLILRLKRCLNYIVMYNMLILIVIDPELLFCLTIFNLSNFELSM